MKCAVTTAIVVLLVTQHAAGEPLAEIVAGAATGGAVKPAISTAMGVQKLRPQSVDYCMAPVSWRAAGGRAAVAPKASGKKTDSMLALCALFAMGLIAYRRLNDPGS